MEALNILIASLLAQASDASGGAEPSTLVTVGTSVLGAIYGLIQGAKVYLKAHLSRPHKEKALAAQHEHIEVLRAIKAELKEQRTENADAHGKIDERVRIIEIAANKGNEISTRIEGLVKS